MAAQATKKVGCRLAYRLSPDIKLVSWAACLEYNQVRRFFCGARAGEFADNELLVFAITDLLCRLKEPVTLEMHVASGELDPLVLDVVRSRRPDVHIVCCPCCGETLQSGDDDLEGLLVAEEYFAFSTLACREEMGKLGTVLRVFGVGDEWVHCADDQGAPEKYSIDCHVSILGGGVIEVVGSGQLGNMAGSRPALHSCRAESTEKQMDLALREALCQG